ncbi:AAA domain-containing protein [Pacificibacter marinus]|uniref:Viral (Superfamily 1) RNA helicase n=1 Tax=Pacificibacter marinus TaxID=658057 RepID=A0A1Y5T344_9RHOB|nr:AAA domain-containing protein [Pacificibacter marinus]SEL00130.1 Part of AAA domain-containing protein [Pacificibacter marinus]SLN54689.1 Viral (Superfamily 1) RNA helicase [Pacificibacter marinus]
MTGPLDAILCYWRTSLADGALGEGSYSHRDRNRFIEVSPESLRDGRLPTTSINKLFKDRPRAQTIGVRLWPLVVARRTSHGSGVRDGRPDLVGPVVTEAVIDREGCILPQRSTIARDVLTPLPSDAFSIGQVATLDDFLTTDPLHLQNPYDWAGYLAHSRKMLDAVTQGWPEGDEHYRPAGYGFLEPAEDAAVTVRSNLDLYDKVLTDKPNTPLLENFAAPRKTSAVDPMVERALSRRLGHSNPDFPLAAQQRQVLAWLDAAQTGEVIAVNGPPGTGKTTMLLSAVAGLWVRAALEGGAPPVIVAASSNNQAVTNIIDAFGQDFATGAGPFAGRWLPEVDSYGIFLPANSRRREAAEKYQTEEFQTRMETVDVFEASKVAWLTSARAAFPDIIGGITEFVEALRQSIMASVKKLNDADLSLERLVEATVMANPLGPDPQATEQHAKALVEEKSVEAHALRNYRAAFDHHIAAESSLTAVFSFIPSVERKRTLRTRIALSGLQGIENLNRVEDIDRHLLKQTSTADADLATSEDTLRKIKSLRAAFACAEAENQAMLERLGGEDGLEDHLDLGMRFDMFRLATHYWEGRWLLAMEEDLAEIAVSANKRGKATLVPRWHRRMMLTPCAVSTFATLPTKLAYSRRSGGKWANEYLYNFIDLLIIDEAGQVLPEVAGAAFSLAKRALVIGDTRQIEPISSLPRSVDIGNLRKTKFLSETEGFQSLKSTAFCSTSGSAMRLAQAACQVSPWPDLDQGLWLFEHRRCHDEIISFSNALCYKGKLRPMRGAVPSDALLPAMGYVHVDGRAIRSGNSRINPTEAQTIAAWIAENREALEEKYNRPIEQIVGIVTPFGAQVRTLRAACSAQKISTLGRDGMTIGTVHALQGAERPVVIFSSVYSKHADGGFIDASPSMLNVTVSRAKDSFLLFGDMDLLASATPGSPRALLSAFLDRPGRDLDFEPMPRLDLQERNSEIQSLRDAVEHDAFIQKILSGEGQKYLIVSPWIKLRTMKRTGILKALKTATERGATIDIYADPLLNASLTASGATQIDEADSALRDIGVSLHRLEKLHSKIVAVDDDLLCVGSFNWLSADREGQYMRHETSYVYRGAHVEEEIRVTTDDLKRRKK